MYVDESRVLGILEHVNTARTCIAIVSLHMLFALLRSTSNIQCRTIQNGLLPRLVDAHYVDTDPCPSALNKVRVLDLHIGMQCTGRSGSS